MWVMTTKGFYSVVETKDGMAMVRTRDRADLEALVDATGTAAPILETSHADYPFRVIVTKEEWARFVYDEARAIDYSNFKAAVTKRQGGLRHDVYMRVWSALHGIEERRHDRWEKKPRRGSWDRPTDKWDQIPLPLVEVDPFRDDAPGMDELLLEQCECDHRLADHGDETWIDHFDSPQHLPDDCADECPKDECQVDGCLCGGFTERAVVGR